jgi:hypothetical protein
MSHSCIKGEIKKFTGGLGVPVAVWVQGAGGSTGKNTAKNVSLVTSSYVSIIYHLTFTIQ